MHCIFIVVVVFFSVNTQQINRSESLTSTAPTSTLRRSADPSHSLLTSNALASLSLTQIARRPPRHNRPIARVFSVSACHPLSHSVSSFASPTLRGFISQSPAIRLSGQFPLTSSTHTHLLILSSFLHRKPQIRRSPSNLLIYCELLKS